MIEKILRGHRCVAMIGGLWRLASPEAPSTEIVAWLHEPWRAAAGSDERPEVTFVDEATF